MLTACQGGGLRSVVRLVTFRVDGETSELVRRLYDERVVVRDIPGLGWIRVSCGWWTSDEDLDRLVGALS